MSDVDLSTSGVGSAAALLAHQMTLSAVPANPAINKPTETETVSATSRSATVGATASARTDSAAVAVGGGLGAMARDVAKVADVLRLDAADANQLQSKFQTAAREKVQLDTLRSGGRLGVTGVQLAVNNRTGESDVKVTGSVTVETDNGGRDYAGSSRSESLVVGLDGRTADPRTASSGVYFDIRGSSGREFVNFLSEKPATADGRTRSDAGANDTPPNVPDALSAAQAKGKGHSQANRGIVPEANPNNRSPLPVPADTRQRGVPDDKDPGFQSVIVMRSGSGVSPQAQAGVTRVQFDIVTDIGVRPHGNPSGPVPIAVRQERADGPVTKTAKVDLQA